MLDHSRLCRPLLAVACLSLSTLPARGAPGPGPAGWPVEANQVGAAFGSAVATAGDINGDGYADLLVGAPFHDHEDTDEGAAFLYLGDATGLSNTPAWTVEGNQAGARFGAAVATAGDVNGDGFADVIIGASGHDNGETDEGRAYVFLGGPAGLATTPAWTVESDNPGAQLGASVAPAGDVNGDGYSDVIVGAWNYQDTVDLQFEGRAFVYLGSSTGLATAPAWTTEGNEDLSRFGWAVATAGDVNGDGYSDVIVGAPDFDNDQAAEGRAFVYLGSAAGPSATAAWTTESNQISAAFGFAVGTAGDLDGDGYSDVAVGAPLYDNLPDADGGRVFIYFGTALGLNTVPGAEHAEVDPGARFGSALSTAGDTNGDGCADLLVGAANYGGNVATAGGTYLFRGRCKGGQEADFDWLASGNQQLSAFGAAVATAGDVNGDGYADVVVGAPAYDNGEADEGRTYVYLGEPGGQPDGFPANNTWVSEGDQADGQWAAAVSSAGDVNGDGYADLIVGAPLYDKGEVDEGAVFVYLGSESGLGSDAVPGSPADWFIESNQAGARLGSAVSTAGDINGDGYADVVIGASGYDNGQPDEGQATLYLGGPAGLGLAPAWTIESNQAGANLGAAVGTAGDVNGDGYSDVVVGASGFDNGQLDEGRALVFLGRPGGLAPTPAWTAESNEPGAGFGSSVASAGDVNGDGYSDLIVGAPLFDNDQIGEGRTFVYLGSAAGLSTVAGWTAESNQDGAAFGYSVASAGDVNGDGYSDVIVGAPYFDNGGTNSGDASVYLGGAAGLATAAAWNLQGTPQDAGQEIGFAVSSAGDVNADGYSDIIIGFPGRSLPGIGGAANSGGAAVYLGSAGGPGLLSGGSPGTSEARVGAAVAGAGDLNGDGLADYVIGVPSGMAYQSEPAGLAYVAYRNTGTFSIGLPVRQRRDGDTSPLAPLGASGALSGVNLQVIARSPFGRSDVRLEYEIKPLGQLLDGTGLQLTPDWADSGVLGTPLAAAINNLSPGTGYRWRLRVKYRSATTPFQAHGPWLMLAANGAQELDFRTEKDTDGDGVFDRLDNCTLFSNTNQRDTNGDGFGNRCDPDFNHNGITDSQDGALLKAAFGSPGFPDRDLNGNGIVDSQDGAILKSFFGRKPGPSGLKP
ncbi:MAG: FG-GAP-like repeat-containing protein [Gammaproteobacteria bacterium]|nr:FG-GAP-like repeat-containing protein [Gammaproteobacteria bacterium]